MVAPSTLPSELSAGLTVALVALPLAWAAGRVFLALNEVPIQDVDVDQAEALVMSVASGTLTEVSDIARELRKLYV